MTVSTSEDESRRGPPNVRSTLEIGKPLYVNGNRVDEGHSIRFSDIMEAVIASGGRVTRWASVEVDYTWMEGRSDLPETLGECVLQPNFPAGLLQGTPKS